MRVHRFALAAFPALTALGCTRAIPAVPADRVPLAATAITVMTAAPPAEAKAAPPLPAATALEIAAAANGAVTRGEVPGAVIAVVHGGALVFLAAYGLLREQPTRRPMTTDRVFDLASLTKAVVTAPCVHLLAEEGKVAIEAPVARYLPAFGKRGKERITVEQLLLHTGGLVPDNALADYRGSRADALARIDALAPVNEPGAKLDYSDVGEPHPLPGGAQRALTDQRLPGVSFTATTFTPSSSVFAGERCQGVLLRVEDRARFQPVRAGLSIAGALLRLHREAWEAKNVMVLLGHRPTFAALLRGDSLDAMASGWEPDLRAFREVRKRYLLYLE